MGSTECSLTSSLYSSESGESEGLEMELPAPLNHMEVLWNNENFLVLMLESVETETKPHEDISPPSFLERWYSSWTKRYICDIWD
jgi:hypothetical protein